MKINILVAAIVLVTVSCKNGNTNSDATGTFEADETIISSEVTGKLLQFNIEEGQQIDQGLLVGQVDSTQLYLTMQQLTQSRKAILAGRPDVKKQIEATKKQIDNAKADKQRYENLVKGDVASQKQLDDIDTRLAVLEAQLSAQQNSLNTTTASLDEQSNSVTAQLLSVEDQLKKCSIVNPVNGIVLAKYVMQNETVTPGKPLYKIADLSYLNLRAYVTSGQLHQFKLGQKVKVLVDAPDGGNSGYDGTVTWVSDKSEFTPKTIQTKDERANLVYAIKIKVKNDGYLKLGMYGEVLFN